MTKLSDLVIMWSNGLIEEGVEEGRTMLKVAGNKLPVVHVEYDLLENGRHQGAIYFAAQTDQLTHELMDEINRRYLLVKVHSLDKPHVYAIRIDFEIDPSEMTEQKVFELLDALETKVVEMMDARSAEALELGKQVARKASISCMN